MEEESDFSDAERGPEQSVPAVQEPITLRLDEDLLQWFEDRADAAGGGDYQTLINSALREYVEGQKESLEATLRRVIREELRAG